jgi:catechol 2,3-dioxygenase-like lactoylglutathione lyase family enzyme
MTCEGLGFAHAQVVQIRIARPTNRFDDVVAFYRDGLGLPVLERFEGHDGYDGVMLGLPEHAYHLELTRYGGRGPCPAPDKDSLMVLYIPDPQGLRRLRNRLEVLGYSPVEPVNPYWAGRSVTYEDPDGWRVVLCAST